MRTIPLDVRSVVKHLFTGMQGYTRRNTYNQLQAKPDNGKHR